MNPVPPTSLAINPRTDYDSFKDVLTQFDFTVLKTIQKEATKFIGFGQYDSVQYRKLFMESTSKLSASERTMVVALATVVKNKTRIVNSISDRFGDAVQFPWAAKVKAYYMSNTKQYVSEKDPGKFPVVNIPSCAPPIAAIAWCSTRTKDELTVDNFLKQLWAAQLHLTEDMQDKQKGFEKEFWEKTITKSRSNTGSYKPGFHEDFYNTKAGDTYCLLLEDSSLYEMGGPYSEKDIRGYVERFQGGAV